MTTLIDYKKIDLLLREQLNPEQISNFLQSLNFKDWQAAHRSLLRMAETDELIPNLNQLYPFLLEVISKAANPNQTLINFEQFLDGASDKSALLQYLNHEPRMVEILITLFAGSQFLSEILFRHPEYFEQLKDRKQLAQTKTVHQFYAESIKSIQFTEHISEKLDNLRKYQKKELLRIGASDLMGLLDFQTVTLQISNLADSLVRACLEIAAEKTQIDPQGFAVLAMGKLGGQELNYSSDIDLLFIVESIPIAYRKLGESLINSLSKATGEGFLYRVDMRLRPWGRDGPLISSLEDHFKYIETTARLWEKQALLKTRVISGEERVGIEFLNRIQPLVFDVANHNVRAEVSLMKKSVEANLRIRGENQREVKHGEGSIRDIEFLTQYLQLIHGANRPEIRSRNTIDALARLRACDLLPVEQFRILTDGYTFLRIIEHHLQLMHYRQTHLIPSKADDITYLANRLAFSGKNAGKNFMARYQEHTRAIREIYEEYLGGSKIPKQVRLGQLPSNIHGIENDLSKHVSRMNASYREIFSNEEIEKHEKLIQFLDENTLAKIEATSLTDHSWQLVIVGYDYLGALSVICGLLFIYGFNIQSGQIFTYESVDSTGAKQPGSRRRRKRISHSNVEKGSLRKIVDVFRITQTQKHVSEEIWQNYETELVDFLRKIRAKQSKEVQGELAKRVANTLRQTTTEVTTSMQPILIDIDNTASEHHTILRIDASDTIGFLYELTNALTLNGIFIWRVMISSIEDRLHDTIFVTDIQGQKITEPSKQRELRIATTLVKHFVRLLPNAPNPESALLHFREFIEQLFQQSNWMNELVFIQKPDVMDALAKLFGVSDFLWTDFLRLQHHNLFPVLKDLEALSTVKSKADLRKELNMALNKISDESETVLKLNEFKDREMFRIDMRHIQGYITEFGQFSAELSDLAEVIVETAFAFCEKHLVEKYGMPVVGSKRSPITLFALGKFGGREMGFASDIELMFIYEGKGKTIGPNSITNAEYFEALVHEVRNSIHAKRAGVFEIDMRMRPYGKAGRFSVTKDAFQKYFDPDGPAWNYERQALVKLRPIAGDPNFGKEIVELRDKILYTDEPFDVISMRAMRERQIRQLVTGGTLNAKFSPGCLVDLEYLVQGLQITHGKAKPELKLQNTRQAILKLHETGIITKQEEETLTNALVSLRLLIDSLRVVRGNTRDLTVPSTDTEEFYFLARRLGYLEKNQLKKDILKFTTNVQELNNRLLPYPK